MDVTLNATYRPSGIMADYDRNDGGTYVCATCHALCICVCIIVLYIDGDGSVSVYQAIFNSISIIIDNSEPDTEDRIICFSIFDGQQPSDPSCVTLKIVPKNDNPPDITLIPYSLSYTENGQAVPLLFNLTITDIDHPHVFPMQMSQVRPLPLPPLPTTPTTPLPATLISLSHVTHVCLSVYPYVDQCVRMV